MSRACSSIGRRGLLATGALMVACAPTTDGPKDSSEIVRVFRGATLIDGTGAEPIADVVIVVRGDRIEAVGSAGEIDLPAADLDQTLAGMWIVPGLVDAHVHFSQTGWFDARPDALDLRQIHPYEAVVARLASLPELFFEAYLCSGVTAVFDVGGYPWSVAFQERGEADPLAVRVAATGPLLSTIDFWLNLPDERQFAYMADSAAVRDAVRENAEVGASAIKVWYITPPQPPDTVRMQALVRLAAAEAAARGLPLVVHATGLWEAKDAIRAGARVLVHGVFDSEVDEEFLVLAREAGVIYTPTIVVMEGYRNVFAQVGAAGLPYPADCADEGTRALLDSELPPEQTPSGEMLTRHGEYVESNLVIGMENLRRVHEAGIAVALGTDAGNPGTLHGPSIHYEAEIFQEAGLTPMQVLISATRDAARTMGREADIGTVEPGKLADFVILRADPLADVKNLREVARVVKGGRMAWPPE